MSKLINSSRQQVETAFAVLERNVGLPGSQDELPPDGSPAFEKERHRHDAIRKGVISRCLTDSGVTCSDDNILVISHPTWDTPLSYWKSIHDLIVFWHFIAGKTLIVPGSALVSLFRQTIDIIMNMEDLKSVNIDVGAILLELVRAEFSKAMDLTRTQFDTIIVQPIREMQAADLKKFRLKRFIQQTNQTIISVFQHEANEIHPLICETFASTHEESCHVLRAESSKLARSEHSNHAMIELIGAKMERLAASTESEIEIERQRLLQNLAQVD
jgi:hypothetical protein